MKAMTLTIPMMKARNPQMSEAAVSHIRMASSANKGAPDLAVPLSLEHDHRRSPWRAVLDLSLTQMLAFVCAIMASVIIMLGIVATFALITDSNQRTRLNQQGTQINELQIRVDTLTDRVTTLERSK